MKQREIKTIVLRFLAEDGDTLSNGYHYQTIGSE
jgi:hypothetical protein